MTDAQLSRVAAELAMDAGYRASAYPPRVPGPAAWSQDYGPKDDGRRWNPRDLMMASAGVVMVLAAIADKIGWTTLAASPGPSSMAAVMAALCPGTRCFASASP